MAYVVTPQALKTLTEVNELPSEFPQGWFNWTDGNTSRLMICLTRKEIVALSNATLALGYGCMLITSTEDDLRIIDLEGLSNDVIPYVIDALPTLEDPSEYKQLRVMLQTPEKLIMSEWMALLMGGGAPFECKYTSPSQWWEYGRELKSWISIHKQWDRFTSWRDVPGVDYVVFSLEHFNLSAPWTVNEIPQLEQNDILQFYPTYEMPCCGIVIDTKGNLHTIGALPTESDGSWRFDDGSIRQAFEQKAKEILATV